MAETYHIASAVMAASGEKLADIYLSQECNTVQHMKRQVQTQYGFSRFQQRLFLHSEDQPLPDTYVLDSSIKQVFMVLLCYITVTRHLEIELLLAIREDQTEMVEAILQRPQHPDSTTGEICQACNRKQMSALHLAARCNRTAIFQTLLEAKADVTRQGNDLCLHEAAANDNLDITIMLVQAGAQTNVQCPDIGTTPLIEAASRGHWQILYALLHARAHTNLSGPLGCTPLHFACSQHSMHPVLALLQHSASLNTKNQNGDTPLHVAFWTNNTAMLLNLRRQISDLVHECCDSDNSDDASACEDSHDDDMSLEDCESETDPSIDEHH